MFRMHMSLYWAPFLILLVAGSALAAKDVVLDKDPNLVGWWKFDETTGKTAADASRGGRNGTLKGGLSFATSSAPGKTGKAIKLGGGEALIEVTGYKGVNAVNGVQQDLVDETYHWRVIGFRFANIAGGTDGILVDKFHIIEIGVSQF